MLSLIIAGYINYIIYYLYGPADLPYLSPSYGQIRFLYLSYLYNFIAYLKYLQVKVIKCEYLINHALHNIVALNLKDQQTC